MTEWSPPHLASSGAGAPSTIVGFHPADPSARRICGVCRMFDATRGVAEATDRAIWTGLFCRYCAQSVPETIPLHSRCRQVPPPPPARTPILFAHAPVR